MYLDAGLPPTNALLGVGVIVIGVLAFIAAIGGIVVFAVYIGCKCRQNKEEKTDDKD